MSYYMRRFKDISCRYDNIGWYWGWLIEKYILILVIFWLEVWGGFWDILNKFRNIKLRKEIINLILRWK